MKKHDLFSDEYWVLRSHELGSGTTTPQPGATNDTLFVDEGDPYALAVDAAAGSGSVSAGGAKPVATIAQLADYLINGYWQYTGTIAHHWASNTITYNINALNAAEQFLAQSAFQAWHDVANINFVQTSGAANITFSNTGSMQAYTNAAWYSSGEIAYANIVISSDWIANDGGAYDGKTGIDSYGYQTYVHEIGHALGLGHQGPYNGSASYSANATYANDTWQYSIMSYFAENNYSGSSYRYVVTPQMADIYAIGSIYGAASSTRTGDTVYGFNSNAGAVFNFSAYSPAPALTIYDNGGNDTLDCSGYSSAQVIDLRPGTFSSVGGLVNNIGIALNAIIENAIGGSGNDQLTASDASCTLSGRGGNDTLVGGAGSDRLIGGTGIDNLTGGAAADMFLFAFGDSSSASGQHDRITDFTTGVDHVDLSGIDAISGTGGYDFFRFIETAGFNGSAGELNYFYNGSLGITTLQGDTNGDRVADFAIDLTGNVAINSSDLIGAAVIPVVIEALGTTTLTQVGANFYLYANGTSTGPTLKYGGSAVVADQMGGWTPIGVEKTATGYQVAWKVAGQDQYSVWNTDGSGNYVTNAIGVVSAASSTLKSFETSFQQDLNGDGTVGLATKTIESAGSTKLVLVGDNYRLDGASGSGPVLKMQGTAVVADQMGGWTPIGVEKTATGYQVAWKVAGQDQYSVWNTDGSGNYVTNAIGVVSAASSTLKSFETSFQQDLNGDGTVGLATKTIESAGSTKLVLVGDNYRLDGASGSGPVLKMQGTAVVADQMGGWTPIGVEKTATGYQVAWKVAGQDQYSVWNTDGSGNYITNAIGVVSAASSTLKSFETSFQQDLNGDGVIGVPSADVLLTASAAGSTFIFGTHVTEVAAEGYFAADRLPSWSSPAAARAIAEPAPIFGGHPGTIAELPHQEHALYELQTGFFLTS